MQADDDVEIFVLDLQRELNISRLLRLICGASANEAHFIQLYEIQSAALISYFNQLF